MYSAVYITEFLNSLQGRYPYFRLGSELVVGYPSPLEKDRLPSFLSSQGLSGCVRSVSSVYNSP